MSLLLLEPSSPNRLAVFVFVGLNIGLVRHRIGTHRKGGVQFHQHLIMPCLINVAFSLVYLCARSTRVDFEVAVDG